jgi:hypothetical protein
MTQTHWKKFVTRGSQYPITPSYKMLTQGEAYQRLVKKKGSQVREEESVLYDRDYIVSYLQHRFIKPLIEADLDTLQKLLIEAYELEKKALDVRLARLSSEANKIGKIIDDTVN